MGLHVVHEGKEDGISPAEHPSEVVMRDINSPQVPVLIVEEIYHVDHVEDIYEDHAVGDIAVLLVLSTQEGDVDEGPCDDSWSAVVEQFEVPELTDSWVHLDSHEEVVDLRAGELSVLGVSREVVGLNEDEQAEDIPVNLCDKEEPAVELLDDGG